jgi:hypothetical protein
MAADGGAGPERDHRADDDRLAHELRDLERAVAEDRVDRAVQERRHAAWMARQVDEPASVVGVLVTLAERRRPVVVELLDGRRHRGTVVRVGLDMAELHTTAGVVLVATTAVAAVRATGALAGPRDAAPAPRTDLATELAHLAADRPRVRLLAHGGRTTLVGRLVEAGPQLVVLRLDGGDLAYVPLAALAEVSLPESG